MSGRGPLTEAHAPLRATYRLQLNGGFPLVAAAGLVPYLARLGVSHVYSSPLLRARRGSAHGYDVVDPAVLNPEVGTEDDLRGFVEALRRHGMGLVLDIVPNHMATGHENRAWDDVLAHGPSSPFARWFDIDWEAARADRHAKVVLPVLGDTLARVLTRGEIRLRYADGTFRFHYGDHSFPLDPATVPRIVRVGPDRHQPRRGGEHPDLRELAVIVQALRSLPTRAVADSDLRVSRRSEGTAALHRLAALCERSASIRMHVERAVATINDPRAEKHLRSLLTAQAYRLVHWRRAGREVNYRRFFSINDLAGVRVEDPAVFTETHGRILAWVSKGLLDALRVDHVDGLLDPLSYLERLRAAVADARSDGTTGQFPIYVEKILSEGEHLCREWPVQGTTGYEFLNQLEALFLHPAGVAAIEEWYRRLIRRRSADTGLARVVEEAKRRMLETEFACDLQRLARRLRAIAQHDPQASDLSMRQLSTAITEVIACLPVYRTYVESRTKRTGDTDRHVIEVALAGAHRRRRAVPAALRLLRSALLLEARPDGQGPQGEGAVGFVQRFQQLSGPAMAKGLEDTALYIWVPVVARNEVGGSPGAPLDDAAGALHGANRTRAALWPATMLCTSTHDTKRSGDVRARLDVLSEIPADWADHVARWRRLNHRRRRTVRGRLAPDPNTEYLLYQTLVGIWPLTARGQPKDAAPDRATLGSIQERSMTHMRKAVREAKVHTSWVDPDPAFEEALDRFIGDILEPAAAGETGSFVADLARFVGRIARPGLWNALSRTLVHLTAPGVPDLYLGDEVWCFTLVDPDNRRPVDFPRRQAFLADVEAWAGRAATGRSALLRDLVAWPEEGRIKLHVVRSALAARRDQLALFTSGTYEPLTADGPAAGHVFAFARQRGESAAITVVPRLVCSLLPGPDRAPAGSEVWGETYLSVPSGLPGRQFVNAVTGEAVDALETRDGSRLRVADALPFFPVALLVTRATP